MQQRPNIHDVGIDFWDDDGKQQPDFSDPRFLFIGANDPSLGKNKKSLADRRRLLTHDLGKVILELYGLDPELVVGPLIVPLQAAAGFQCVLDDLVGFPPRDVRDDACNLSLRTAISSSAKSTRPC